MYKFLIPIVIMVMAMYYLSNLERPAVFDRVDERYRQIEELYEALNGKP